MSNLGQYYGKGFPYGGSLSMPYGGDVLTFADGSQWIATTPTAPFAYTSEYAHLPSSMTSPHPLMNGPENGLFVPMNAQFSIAYDPGTGTYCTSSISIQTNGQSGYYTSADGSNWTYRTFPTTNITFFYVVFTGGKFFALSTASSTVLVSTDAITWSTYAFTATLSSLQDVLTNGTGTFVAINTTTSNYSTNGGATWTLTTLAASPSNLSMPGQGVGTWNAGAGLFIVAAGAGSYQTSPDGITWTLRATQASYAVWQGRLTATTKFASNATTTVAMGLGGFFAVTADGLTWTNHGYVSNTQGTSTVPSQLYFDGTRFVARINHRVFYSTNGTSWTEGAYLGGATVICPQSNGVLFLLSLLTNNVPSKCLRVADVTLTTPQTVANQLVAVAQGTNASYYRIK